MFRRLCLAVLLMIAADGTGASGSDSGGLGEFRWKNRVILVFAGGPAAVAAQSDFEAVSGAIGERDILWFILDADTSATNYAGGLDPQRRETLRKRYLEPAPPGTAVILVGKDGTVKSRSSDLDLGRIFDLIDSMPMRRAEMRQRGDGA